MNGDEVEIVGAKVDGYDESTDTVYQFHGCYWHGCPRCYPDQELLNTVKKTTVGVLYEATIERFNRIRAAGYNLVETWVCEWKNSRLYKEYIHTVDDLIESINPCNA